MRREISDSQLQLGTGKNWSEWFAMLDEWGAETRSVLAITRYLTDTHSIRDFWAQVIAVDYKWERWMAGGSFRPIVLPATASVSYPD